MLNPNWDVPGALLKDLLLPRNAEFQIKIWGARGSLPAPLDPTSLEKHVENAVRDYEIWKLDQSDRAKQKDKNIEEFLKGRRRSQFGGYGGNTPCVEVRSKRQQLIIDGGSGIRPLGYEMLNGPAGEGKGEMHLFMTHFHWDHLLGLPFFTPLFIPGNVLHVYSVQPEVKSIFHAVFKKPFFPVSIENLGARIEYHILEPRKPFVLGDLEITPYQLDHPDPCWGIRVQKGGRVYSHCVDTECVRSSRVDLGLDLPLYQGVDLMLFDAQYTIIESFEKVNWGHATALRGLDIAMREGTKRMIFIHHDPASSNEKIAAAEAQARLYYQAQKADARNRNLKVHEVDWEYGYDGMVLTV